MIRHLPILLLFACGAAYSPSVTIPVTQPSAPVPVTKPPVSPPVTPPITPPDTSKLITSIHARPYDIREFGAKVDGVTDDIIADSTACAYCIINPAKCSMIVFPVGVSRITKPLFISNNGKFFTLTIHGVHPAKESSNEYLSTLYCDYKSGYGIGVQLGRNIVIDNMAITGQYKLPYSFSALKIVTSRFNDWIDPTITDSRYWPYAGISIDPYPNKDGSTGGTSGVEIRQCAIKQWMVGIALSPSGFTLNDEMINMIDDDIEVVRVGIAICQDQSKEIHIDRFKCWAACHTILDGHHYGNGTGGGSVSIQGGNIAGTVNELFNLYTDRFPLSVKDLYSESLFRIGTIGNGCGANFINCQIDFLSLPGQPEPDFMLNGTGNFYGGCLRYYDNIGSHRMFFVNVNAMFRDMTLNSPPIITSLVSSGYAIPTFSNVHLYNQGICVNSVNDTFILIHPSSVKIDSVAWTSTVTGVPNAVVGDYILGNPAGGSGNYYYDQDLRPGSGCPTIQIGRVASISGGTLYLTNIGLNAPMVKGYNSFYICRLK